MLHRLRSAKQNIGLLILLSFGIQTSMIANSPLAVVNHLRYLYFLFSPKKNNPQQEEKTRLRKLQRKIKKKMEYKNIALQVLNSEASYHHNNQSIITKTEFEELQIGRLMHMFDQTETSFGLIGLNWLLKPIANFNEIKKRQTIIKTIAQNQKLFNQLQHALRDIKESETALLNYWRQQYHLHNSAKGLFEYTGQNFITNFFNKQKSLAEFCNKKESLLESSVWFQFADAAAGLAKFSLSGIINDFSRQVSNSFWLGSSIQGISLETTWRSLKEQWYYPFKRIDPRTYILNPLRSSDDLYAQNIHTDGITRNKPNWNALDEQALQRRRMYVLGAGSFGDKLKFIKECYNSRDYNACYAGVTELVFSLQSIYWLYRGTKFAWDNVKGVYNTSQKMHIQMTKIARLFRSLEKFEQLVSHAPALKMCNLKEHFAKVTNKNKQSAAMQELRALLATSTFDTSGTFWHRRGRVLKAHKLLTKTKKEMVYALQAIAEFDAYFSLAKVVRNNKNKFSFVTFVDQKEPMMNIKKCWLPLLPSNQAVFNDVIYGVDNGSTKGLITGPNGGGKSTYLKSLGHAVVLGQSVGIVPGQNAQMTLFTGLRTSLAPKEDLSRGISTFMAQKERIKMIEDFMKQSKNRDRYLIMLDEPYSGTTDDEAANRIWNLGKRAAHMPQSIALIATHVKKPIELAKETKGIFVNYQVEIDEPKQGQFKRTFKVKPGAAMWWFNNPGRRSRFVDWLDDEIKHQAQKRNIFQQLFMQRGIQQQA